MSKFRQFNFVRRSNYSSMVLHAIKENFRCAEAFLLRIFFFLKYRDKLTTKQKNVQINQRYCVARVLIFTIFAIFPAIRKNNFPQKINENIFPAKIYFRVLSILLLKFTTRKYSTKKSCLFNQNLPLQFRNKTVK